MRSRKLKNMIIRLAVTALLAAAMPLGVLTAWASNAKISFSDPSATVGTEVSVTMKVTSTSGDALDHANIMLSYDPAALEFISGTNASGGAGSVSVKPSAEGGDGKTMAVTLKFKPLQAGTTKITVSTQEIYDSSEQLAALDKQGDSTVTIGAQEGASSDASLKSLKVSPGNLSPEFSTDVEEYSISVGTDVSKIAISAESSGTNAKVAINGGSDLQMGENTVTCVVTAEDGTSTKTYTIHVNKVEGGETAPVTAVGDLTAVIGSEQYTVTAAFDTSSLPEGFEAVSYSYKGNEVMAGRGTEKDLLLLYLTDSQGSGDFFIYNEGSDTWTPYVEISTTSKAVVILPKDDTVKIPEGFTEGIMNLENGRQALGWVVAGEENPQYWLFYGMNWNGEKALYRYDLQENTIQRYFQDPIGANGSISAEQYRGVVAEYKDLLHHYDLRGMIILLLGVVIAVLLIAVAFLIKKAAGAAKRPETASRGNARRRALEELAATEDEDAEDEGRKKEEVRKPSRAPKQAKLKKEEPVKAPEPAPLDDDDSDFEMIDLDLDEEEKEEDDDGFEFIDVEDDSKDNR